MTIGAALAEADIPTISTAGKVSGSAINTGTIGGTTAITTSGNLVTTGTVQGAIVNGTNIRAYNGSNYVQLAAPALGGNINFSLPAADGAAGTLMKTDGAGQLSFGALSASDIPSLDAAKLTTGTLPIARGGTGLSSFGNNSVLVSNGTGSAISSLNCALGEVIKFDVSGFAGCGTDATGSGSQWTTNASNIYFNTGRVGIGLTTPAAALDVLGANTTVGNAPAAFIVNGGTSTAGGGASGGAIGLKGGLGDRGGNISLTGGDNTFGASGGYLTIEGGNWGGPGGIVTLSGGLGKNGSVGGTLSLKGGNNFGGGQGGTIDLAGGTGTANGNGGDLTILGGAKAGSGTDGNILLATTRGKVGIGTASPSVALSFGTSGATATPKVINFFDYDNSIARGRIVFNTPASYVGLGTLANGSIFPSKTTETGPATSTPLVVTQTGNVGIGTTNPSGALDVAGQAISTASATYVFVFLVATMPTVMVRKFFFSRVAATVGTLAVPRSSKAARTAVPILRVYRHSTMTGVDGFGTAGSTTLVGGDGVNGSGGGAITFTAGRGDVGTSGGHGGSIALSGGSGGGNGGDISITGGAKSGGTTHGNVLLAPANGNVGIGTSTPGAALEVKSSGTTKDHFLLSGNPTGGATIRRTASSGTIEIWGGSTFNDGGAIYVNGNTSAAPSDQGSVQLTLGKSTSKFEVFGSDTDQKLLLTDAGNFGVGNTSPGTLLHVGSALVGTGVAVAKFQNIDGTCTMTPASSGSGIACSSDERLKENIAEVTGQFALDHLNKIQAVTYNFKTDPHGKSHTGYLAQEIQKVAPEFVRKNEDGFYQVYYDGLIPWITEGIKALHGRILGVEVGQSEQQTEIESLKSKIDGLIVENKSKDQRINELEQRLERLEKAINSR
ncbi:MAG: tail fiber domain-containing protein [Bdellovibrionales bacterium]|nr:tail fiber domain-containing protein [Bdellovibrionales bacterium]